MKPSDTGKRITTRDIALKLNISQPTVSRALRNDSQISKAVIANVQKTAKAMGYRPDPFLSALITYRLKKSDRPVVAELAWINCWDDPKWIRSFKEFDLYWQGAYAEAERAGYRLEEFVVNDRLPPSRLAGIFHARNIQGLLIPPIYRVMDWTGFDWNRFAMIRFGLGENFPPAHRVTSDQSKVGITLFEAAEKKGYKRIGFITFRSPGDMPKRFLGGYYLAQNRLPTNRQVPPLILDYGTAEQSRLLIRKWMHLHKPDAILTDEKNLRTLLGDAGINVPGDVAMAVTSVLDGDANAGVNQNSEEIGRAAVQMLISLINHHEFGPPAIERELLVVGNWVDGSDMPDKKR